MSDIAEQEILDLGDMDIEAFNDFAIEQGWSDGMPLYPPTEEKIARFVETCRGDNELFSPKIARFVETCRGDNELFSPMSPRLVLPTLHNIAANAVMAGCRPEYFPAVVAAVRAVLTPEYNLYGTRWRRRTRAR